MSRRGRETSRAPRVRSAPFEDRLEDPALVGELPALQLAEDLLTIEGDLEGASAGANQLGLDPRLAANDVRQTGGSR